MKPIIYQSNLLILKNWADHCVEIKTATAKARKPKMFWSEIYFGSDLELISRQLLGIMNEIKSKFRQRTLGGEKKYPRIFLQNWF